MTYPIGLSDVFLPRGFSLLAEGSSGDGARQILFPITGETVEWVTMMLDLGAYTEARPDAVAGSTASIDDEGQEQDDPDGDYIRVLFVDAVQDVTRA